MNNTHCYAHIKIQQTNSKLVYLNCITCFVLLRCGVECFENQSAAHKSCSIAYAIILNSGFFLINVYVSQYLCKIMLKPKH